MNPAELEAALRRTVQGEVRFDAGARAAYSADASNYRQVPVGVVLPRSVEDMVAAVAACRAHGAPVLPRGGGTSQCGQAVNVAVVIDASKHLDRVLEVDAAARAKKRRLVLFLVLTALLGATFLGIKTVEYAHKWGDGLVPGVRFHHEGPNARQVELFYAFYFALTGIHALHMASFVTGQEVERLSADFASCLPSRRLEDDAMVNFRMSGGTVGRLWTSSVAIGRQHGLGLQVFGETGGHMTATSVIASLVRPLRFAADSMRARTWARFSAMRRARSFMPRFPGAS